MRQRRSDGADEADQADEDRQHRRAADLRADCGERRQRAGAVVGERLVDAVVRAAEVQAAPAHEHVDDEQREQDRQRREDDQSRAISATKKIAAGCRSPSARGEALGEAAGPREQRRDGPAVARRVAPAPRSAAAALGARAGTACERLPGAHGVNGSPNPGRRDAYALRPGARNPVALPLLLLLLARRRWPGAPPRSWRRATRAAAAAPAVAAVASETQPARARPCSRRGCDPEKATGLALTLALARGLGRRPGARRRWRSSSATRTTSPASTAAWREWGDRHATGWSTRRPEARHRPRGDVDGGVVGVVVAGVELRPDAQPLGGAVPAGRRRRRQAR